MTSARRSSTSSASEGVASGVAPSSTRRDGSSPTSRAQRAGPALLLLTRPASHACGERLLVRTEELQLVLHAVQPVEGRHPFCPGAQLTHRLCPPQQEHGQDGALPGVESQCLIEHVAVAHDRAAVGGQHEADQPLVLQLVEGRVHGGLVIADDGLPVRGLVAGGHEGVEGERVLLWRGEGLLHQRAEHACARRAQPHGNEHTARSVSLPGGGTQARAAMRRRWPRSSLGGFRVVMRMA